MDDACFRGLEPRSDIATTNTFKVGLVKAFSEGTKSWTNFMRTVTINSKNRLELLASVDFVDYGNRDTWTAPRAV